MEIGYAGRMVGKGKARTTEIVKKIKDENRGPARLSRWKFDRVWRKEEESKSEVEQTKKKMRRKGRAGPGPCRSIAPARLA